MIASLLVHSPPGLALNYRSDLAGFVDWSDGIRQRSNHARITGDEIPIPLASPS
jgi:hypothetical protein